MRKVADYRDIIRKEEQDIQVFEHAVKDAQHKLRDTNTRNMGLRLR